MLALVPANLQGGEQQPAAKPPGQPSYNLGEHAIIPSSQLRLLHATYIGEIRLRFTRILAAAAVLLGASLTTYASAQVESTPIPAPNKPNFAPVEFLLGTWTCKTKSARRPAAYVTTSTYTLDPTGYWMNETSTTAKTAWVSKPLTTMDRITYDSDSKRWVDVLWGDGGAYGLSFSKGWNGDKIVWHDAAFAPGPDISSQTDITTTKESPTKLTSMSTFTETKTGRHVAVSAVCTKN
jgi:hypothetical protein